MSLRKNENLAKLNLQAPTKDDSVVSRGTFIRLLFYTFLMVTLPISSYFISKTFVYEGFMGIKDPDSIVPSALTAVVMVHVVLGLFVYAAYTEDIPIKPKKD
ncbi:unnamed protein product [Clavelina lepadiformis]|uniref:Vacuolar ATPase assembly integral membrane protein VMA21 homolog n=1 Tax=Clavelina lepadiformis TaxID=159417 RepID=A0ABP0H0R1_CLALP